MAVVADRVIVELEAKLDRYDANVRRAEQTFAKATGSIEQNSRVVTGATNLMGRALAGISTVVAAREFLRLADASKSMEAQLKLATQSFGTYNQAQADVQRIAGETRNGLTETASLYGNLVRATQTLGGTQAQAARATETFSKALKLGGADTNAAAAAILQFGQALASGVLRGDEFNSIAEASPRLLQLLADAIGVPRGELRKLAEEGKLTSDVLYRALTDRKFTAGIDAEFKTLPKTFADAMQTVENAAITTIGAFDRGGQFSTVLANFITDGSGGFERLADKAEEFGRDTRAVFDGLGNVFDPIEANGNAVFDALGIKIYSVSDQIKSLLGSIDDAYNAASTLGGMTSPIFGTANTRGRYQQGERRSQARGRVQAAVRRLEGMGYIVPLREDGLPDEAGIRRRPAAPPPPRASSSGSGSKKTGRTRKPKDEAAEAERFLESLRRDMGALNSDLSRILLNETERMELAGRAFKEVFGDQPDVIADSVAEYEKDTRREVDANALENGRFLDQQEDDIRSLADLWEDLFRGGTDAVWQNFKEQGLRTLAIVAAQAAVMSFGRGGGGFGSLLGNFGRAFGAAGGSFLPSIFGGRASGGHVIGGHTYPVNEYGNSGRVEGFQPAGSGKIIPLGRMNRAGGGGVTLNQTVKVDARGSVNPDGYAEHIKAAVRQETLGIVSVAVKGVTQGVPGRVAQYQRDGV